MIKKVWTFGLTIVFCLILGWIILFHMSYSLEGIEKIRKINLFPFPYDMRGYAPKTEEPFVGMFLFIPLGLYLGILKAGYAKALLIGFLYSLILEVLQFVLMVGVSDTTDLITNTLGVAAGLLLYRLFVKITKAAIWGDWVLLILATVGTIIFLRPVMFKIIPVLFSKILSQEKIKELFRFPILKK